jgi:hypothetical protein
MRRVLKLVAPLLALGLTLSGCKDEDSSVEDGNVANANVDGTGQGGFVERGAEIVSIESDLQLLTASLIASSPGGIGIATGGLTEAPIHPADRPSHGGDHGGTRAIFSPRECLDVANDTAIGETTYTFRDCQGPSGLREITGILHVRARQDQDMLVLELRGDALTVGNAALSWNATASITRAGVDRTMTWRGTLTGQSEKGRDFERKAERTTSWRLGEPCYALNGTSEGTLSGRPILTELQGLRRCRRACPDPGGKLIVTHVKKNERYELSFDGSDVASFDGPQGKTTVRLRCGR